MSGHNCKCNGGVVDTILRVLAYTGCIAASLWAAQFMGDTYAANVGMFVIFSSCLELLWVAPCIGTTTNRVAYVICVVAIGFLATVLLWNVGRLHGQTQHERPAQIQVQKAEGV